MSSKYADIICSNEAGSSFCSSGVSVAFILSNTCCENAMAAREALAAPMDH